MQVIPGAVWIMLSIVGILLGTVLGLILIETGMSTGGATNIAVATGCGTFTVMLGIAYWRARRKLRER